METIEKESSEEIVEIAEKLEHLMQDDVRFYWDFRFAAANYMHIVDKDKKTRLLVFNGIQDVLFQQLLDEMPIRDYVLKARKFGCSTFFLLLYFWDCLTSENTTSTIIAHEYEPSERLFRMVSYCHDRLPDRFKPKTNRDNAREIFFHKLNSYFFVGSAQKKDFGRSDTINNLHMSEFAFWPNPEELLAGLTESVPEHSGNMIVETTPSQKAYFRQFHHECKEGKGAFNYRFFPWFITDEYSKELDDPDEGERIEKQLVDEERLMMQQNELSWEQMKFWLDKRKRLRKKVWQEYPPDDLSCFAASSEQSFFDTRRLQQLYMIVNPVEPIEERDNGKIRIYKYPIPDREYMIASDTSGGLTGTPSASTIIDYETAEEVAELWGMYTPHQLGLTLAVLGEEYNWALLAIERNNHGHSTLNTLTNQLGYPNLYYHIDQEYEEWAKAKSGIGRAKSKRMGVNPTEGTLGWPTDSKTRPLMFSDLREEVIEEVLMAIRSSAFVEECMGVLEKDGVIYSEGLIDRVIARCIVWQMRKRVHSGFSIRRAVKELRGNQSRVREEGGMERMPWDRPAVSMDGIGVANRRKKSILRPFGKRMSLLEASSDSMGLQLRSSPLSKLKRVLTDDTLTAEEIEELMSYDDKGDRALLSRGPLKDHSYNTGRRNITIKGRNKYGKPGWEL